jgi:predicted RNA-binding protein with RPS1 domain
MKKKITCCINDIFSIEEKSYYRLTNIENSEEHIIPVTQVELFKGFNPNNIYDFFAEYNPADSKTYLSIIHPKYPWNSIIEFKVLQIEDIDDQKFFLLESDYLELLKVPCFRNQEELNTITCKVTGYKKGKPILKNVDTSNSKWKLNNIYAFKIVGDAEIYDKKGASHSALELIVSDNRTIKIKVRPWQQKIHWTFPDVNCKVIGIQADGLPKLVAFDSRHPFLKIGEQSIFTIEKFITKIDRHGNEHPIISLIDDHLHKFEVYALPNQENKLKPGDQISCLVEDIGFNVKLKQVDFQDPFYYSYDSIDPDINSFEQYFKPYIENEEFPAHKQLKTQYSEKSGFWVFTYCNKVLPDIKKGLIKNSDLIELEPFIAHQLLFQEWILNKELTKAINNENDREAVEQKVRSIISKCTIELEVIKLINSNQIQSLLEKEDTRLSAIQLLYIIQYSKISNLKACDIIKYLNRLHNDESSTLTRIQNQIRIQKTQFKSREFGEYFIPSTELSKINRENFQHFLDWLYVEKHIYKILADKKRENLLLASIYRYYAQLTNEIIDSKKLLITSFYILSNIENEFDETHMCFTQKLTIDVKAMGNALNKSETLSAHSYQVKIIEKHYKGFKVDFEEYLGYLPVHNIYDQNLKAYDLEKINWVTNVEISLYSREFNFAIVKQHALTSPDYYSENLSAQTRIKKGLIISGMVKRIEDYGVFVTTIYGDGLLHKSQISFGWIESSDIKRIFSIKERIKVKILEIEPKIEFTFKGLYGTDFSEYYSSKLQIVESEYNDDNDHEDLQYKIEFQKGAIFENFALFQDLKEQKIKYLKIAKSFYSNTQNARSYLLNIYVEYFESLRKLDELLEDYSFGNYEVFKKKILEIKEKIQPQTIENFPESKSLLFFIDILYFFNSRSDNDLIQLFNIIKEQFDKNDFKLSIVAKNALANNLIISDLKDFTETNLDDFTKKNLKRIHKYLNHGVHSIEEMIEDRLEKELKEKITYIKGLIKQEEGERLEFKATFLTPIPNNEKQSIIRNLENKLSRAKSDEQRAKIEHSIQRIHEESKHVANIDKILIHSCLKTICAFANTNGGTLIIGVKDDQEIFGLEQDYNSFRKNQNRDEFAKFFDNKVSEYFGNSFSSAFLEKEFIKLPKGDVLVVNVKPSSEEVHILRNELGENEESIYVRNLASSEKLRGKELARFIRTKFEKRIKLFTTTQLSESDLRDATAQN